MGMILVVGKRFWEPMSAPKGTQGNKKSKRKVIFERLCHIEGAGGFVVEIVGGNSLLDANCGFHESQTGAVVLVVKNISRNRDLGTENGSQSSWTPREVVEGE